MNKEEFISYIRDFTEDFERRNKSLKSARVAELIGIMNAEGTFETITNAFKQCKKICRICIAIPILDFEFKY